MLILPTHSEELKLLTCSPKNLILFHLEDIKAHSLRQSAALPDCDNVTLLHIEARRAMRSHVVVALLETVVLLDVVQVVAANDDCALHLCGDGHAFQDFAADADIASEWGLLVHIVTFLCLLWCWEPESDAARIPGLLITTLLSKQPFGAKEDCILLLKGLFVLIHGFTKLWTESFEGNADACLNK